MIKTIGLISAIALSFFNIPLVVRILRRKSSADISLVWAVGVWACSLGMLPSYLVSSDIVLRLYGVINIVLFTATIGVVLYYHPAVRRPPPNP